MVLDHMFTKDDVIEILSYTKKLDLPLEKNSIYVLWKVCIQMLKLVHHMFKFILWNIRILCILLDCVL